MPSAIPVGPELRATIARASARLGGVVVDLDPPAGSDPAGTISAHTLGDPASPVLDRLLDDAGALTGVTDQRLLATWVSGWLAWWQLGPVLAAWLTERRVAPLDPDALTTWWDGTGPAQVALGRGGWTVLAEDALAGAPGVLVARDAGALRATLHAAIVRALEPTVEALRDRARVGVRQQWLQAADRIASALQLAGRSAGSEADGVAAATLLLAQDGSPFTSTRRRFVLHTCEGLERAVLHRGTCCLAVRAPGGSLCLTCPARSAAAIDTGIRDWLLAGAPEGGA